MLQSQNKEFTKLPLFALNENFDSKKFEHEVGNATVMTLNQNALNAVISQKPEYLEFSIFMIKNQLILFCIKSKLKRMILGWIPTNKEMFL